MKIPKEPSSQDCEQGVIRDGGLATWYPQMGGYAARCVIVPACRGNDGLPGFNAYVWHDGEFPFSGRSPVVMHHCDVDQFIEFAEIVRGFLNDRP